MEYLQTGKNRLKEYVKKSGSEAINSVGEIGQKRVLGVLTQRRGEALDLLDCLEARVDAPYLESGASRKRKPDVEALLVSPAVTIVLALIALIAASFLTIIGASSPPVNLPVKWSVILLLSILLLLGQAIYAISRKPKAKATEAEPARAQIMLDVDKATMLLSKQNGKLVTDSQSICDMFSGRQMDSMNSFTGELVKMYASLFEARVDNPATEDFNYSLTLAELLLKRAGLKAIPYSEEKKSLFDIQEEAYRDEMRCPAIIREKDSVLIRKGEYIKNSSR
ncbi:MAG: hypothetical protein IJQ62_05225 [Clostridia bacterium]|nr:hypothetical protein [Clostridia bacterium]